jgi:hypothetical protein
MVVKGCYTRTESPRTSSYLTRNSRTRFAWKALARTNERIAATERLTAAIFKGVEAQRISAARKQVCRDETRRSPCEQIAAEGGQTPKHVSTITSEAGERQVLEVELNELHLKVKALAKDI